MELFLWFNLGFCTLITQVLLQRENITVFSGNELSIGVVLFAWLLFGGLGSAVMGRISHNLSLRQRENLAFWMLIVLTVLLPATLIVTRSSRLILGLAPGEMAGLGPIVACTMMALAPLVFVQGGLFAVYCALAADKGASQRSRRASIVYATEGLGAVLGGVIHHYLLLTTLLPFATVLLVSGLNLACAFSLRRVKRLGQFSAAVCIGLLAVLLAGVLLSSKLDVWSSGLAFGGTKVVAIKDTRYGRLVLARLREQQTMFESGLLLYSYPDRMAAEEVVHIPMLSHPSPQSVLLLGGGCGGVLTELLKYSSAKIDYVQLDAEIIRTSAKFLPPGQAEALRDPRVSIYYADARNFVATTNNRYDVVIINLPKPTNAQLNRFFTVEFLRQVRRILADKGIVALQVPSSETYLSKEAKTFICSVYNTLKSVFQTVLLTPGQTGHFLATDATDFEVQPETLLSRLSQRGIQTTFVTDWSIPVRFEPFRRMMVRRVLRECASLDARVNYDLAPTCYYYALLLWGRQASQTASAVYEWLGRRTRFEVYLVIAAALAVLLVAQRVSSRPANIAVLASLATIGLMEIAAEIIIVIAYQIFFGNIYSMIGLLICSYMGGITAGAFLARSRLFGTASCRPFPALVLLQGIAALFPLATIAMLFVMLQFQAASWVQPVFVGLIFVGGAVGGGLYIFGNAAYSEIMGRTTERQVAGTTYFADLLGSSIGAITVTSFLLPVLGVVEALIAASLVTMVGFCSLLFAVRRGAT